MSRTTNLEGGGGSSDTDSGSDDSSSSGGTSGGGASGSSRTTTPTSGRSSGSSGGSSSGSSSGSSYTPPPSPSRRDDSTAGSSGGSSTDDSDDGVSEIRSRLQGAAQSFDANIAQPIGDAAATASPATEIDRALPGSPVERSVRNFTAGAVGVANLPGLADTAIGTGQRTVDDAQRVAGGERGSVARDLRDDAGATAGAAAGAVSSDPVGSISTGAGALVGGAAAGTAAARGAQRLRSGTGSGGGSQFDGLPGGVDLDDFASDTRAQAGFGRQRSRSDSDSTEQTTIQRTIDEDEGTDTISSEAFVDQRTRNVDDGGVNIEAQLRQMADEGDRLSGRQQTPRQRAEQRVPGQEAFESPAARQREISRLEQRFRTQDMSDLDNRVVPRTGGIDETTRGRFGFRDTPTAAFAGGTTATQSQLQPGAGALESEPVLTDPGQRPAGFAPPGGLAPTTDPSGVTDGTTGLEPQASIGAGSGESTFDTGAGPTSDTTTTTDTTSTTGGTSGTTAQAFEVSLGVDATAQGAGAVGAQTEGVTTQAVETSQLGQTATATQTQIGAQATGATGTRTTTRTPIRFDFEEEQPDDDVDPFAVEADDETFGTGILGGDEAFEREFGNGDNFRF